MARKQLTLHEIDKMSKPAILEWQDKRKEEIHAEEQAKREAWDRKHFEQQFLAAGGDSEDADQEWARFRRESAADAARRADQDAAIRSRRTAFGGV